MLNSKNLLKLIGRNIIICLIVIAFTAVAIYFITKEIEKITDTIVLNHKLEANLKQRTELLSTIDRGAKTIGQNESIINDAYLPSNNISQFINRLDDLVSISGIIQTYRFETPVNSTLQSPYPLSIISYSNNLSTDLQNFSIYLKNYEKLPYFTKIDSLNISSQDSLGWIGLSNITFKATLFTKTTQ